MIEKKTAATVLISLGVGAALLFGSVINGVQDLIKISTATAGNPASNNGRLFVNSATNELDCHNSDGSSCMPGAGSSGYVTVEQAGTPLTQRAVLNFPTNMSCVDNSGNASTDCTPSGGGGLTASPFFLTDGSNYFGPIYPMHPPPTGSFSWVNQGPATAAQNNNIETLAIAPGAGDGQLHLRVATAPATPYTVTAALRYITSVAGSSATGIVMRDSGTGKIVEFRYNQSGVNVYYWTNPSTFSGTTAYDSGGTVPLNGPVWMAITDNGTNFIFKLCTDPTNCLTLATLSRTAFLANPNQNGYEILATGAQFTQASLLSWIAQ